MHQKIISTDSIGFLGNPKQFLYLYQQYFKDKTFDGVEMIAFKPLKRLKNFIETLEKNGIKTYSFHGRTGGENQFPFQYKLMMYLVNFFILDIDNLSKFKNIRILIHTPYAKKEKIKNLILKTKPKLLIENHLSGEKGVIEAIDQIEKYQNLGIKTDGVFDIKHFLFDVNFSQMKKDWLKIIEKIKKYTQWFSYIHFPIGPRSADSLPIIEMTDEMLEVFGKEIIPKIKTLVIENQQNNFGLFYSNQQMLKKQKQRNDFIFKKLKKAKIL